MIKSKLSFLLLLVLSLHICNAQSLLEGPQKIAIDTKRNRLLVSNYGSGDIIQIDNKGIQSYFLKDAGFIDGTEIAGDVIYGVGENRKIIGYDLESSRQVLNLTIPGDPDQYLSSLCSDSTGHLFISIHAISLTDSWTRVPLTSSHSDTSMASHRTAIMTYVSSDQQERSIRAMVKSVRELSRSYSNCKIYIVLADQNNTSCESLKDDNIELLPLQMDSAFADYPLAVKAFAAAQVEKNVGDDIQTLIWVDPGVLILNSLETLDLQGKYDIALRPVTLKNNIGIPPGTEPDGYWQLIYKINKLNYKKLLPVRTIADEEIIQPYYNCEVYSVNPKLGICKEWAIQLTDLLKNNSYQETACTTFLRQLFLHQAVFSAVATSKVKNNRLKLLPLTSSYPFNQHDQLPSASKIKSMNELTVVIIDYAWNKIPTWEDKIPSSEPLKSWLNDTYLKYLNMKK
jgi:hypothetical protein